MRQFQADGMLILPKLIEPEASAKVAARYEGLFRGKFETGLTPMNGTGKKGATVRIGAGKSAMAGNRLTPSPVWCYAARSGGSAPSWLVGRAPGSPRTTSSGSRREPSPWDITRITATTGSFR